MKTAIIKISFIFLFLSLMGAGCEKEDEYEDVPLENIKCPCERDVSFINKIVKANILLFDVKKTSWDEMKTQTFDGEKSEFVTYSEESKSMIFYSIRTTMIGVSYVCNVPGKIDDWTIPSTGVIISFDADAYEACYDHPSIGFLQTNFEIILTTLKEKIK